MTKLQVFWYFSEAVLLAFYIGFLAIMFNNIWVGIIGGTLFVVLRKLFTRALDKVKVEK
jgi:hypothetical protein